LNSEFDLSVAIGGTEQEKIVVVDESKAVQGFEQTLTSAYFIWTSLVSPLVVICNVEPPAKDDYRPVVTAVILIGF